MYNRFNSLTDEELVQQWDNDDAKNALYERMLPTLHKLTAQFSEHGGILGYDSDDLLQEASLAFVRAATTYNPDKQAKFQTYLWICVRSHMLNLAKHAQSASERSVASSVSLYEPLNNDNPDIRLIDTLSTEYDFEENVMREQFTDMVLSIANNMLSPYELNVFNMFYIKNLSISDIANKLNCSKKSIANTLYRIRMKFKDKQSQHNLI